MADVKITVKPNGPYRVEGVVDLVDQAGNHFRKAELAFSLCRCGHSNTKPLCDKSHARVGFQEGATAPVAPVQEAAPQPALEVTTTTKLEE
jgi:CDGSH-type Zn-finger protein